MRLLKNAFIVLPLYRVCYNLPTIMSAHRGIGRRQLGKREQLKLFLNKLGDSCHALKKTFKAARSKATMPG